MINRFFSKKAPTLSLQLDQTTIRSGETLTGQIVVHGGKSDQVLDKLHVQLLFYAKVESEQASSIVHKIEVATAVPLAAKAEARFPFSYQVPELPQSSQYVRYRFQTTAEVGGITHHKNSGDFTVLPSESLRAAQNAWRAVGFKDLPLSGRFNGAVQIFEYEVTKSLLKKRVLEPQAVFLPEQEGVRVHVAFQTPPTAAPQYATVHLPKELLESREQTQQALTTFLENELQNPMPNTVPTLAVFEKQAGREIRKVRGSAQIGDIGMKTLYPFASLAFAEIVALSELDAADAGRGLFESIPFDTHVPSTSQGTGGVESGGIESGGFDIGGFSGGSFDGGSSTN